MKKIIISAIVFLGFSSNIFAQNQFFISGQASFNTSGNSESEAKTTWGAFVPTIGYIINDNSVVGLGVGLTSSKNAADKDNYSKNSGIVIRPFYRYRKPVNDNFALYGEAGLNVTLGTAKTVIAGDTFGDPAKTTSIGVYLGPGIEYSFAENWFVTATWGALSYNTTSIKDVEGSSSSFGLGLSPQNINFALNFSF